MEVGYVDQAAAAACEGKEEAIASLVRNTLGLASVAIVTSMPDGTLKVAAAGREMQVMEGEKRAA